MPSDDELRARYGPGPIISRKGRFALVHLDQPSAETVRIRTRDFDPEVYFESDCPLCELQRSRGIALFDTYPDDEEEIQLE